ncbi:MAG: PPA1309 family protein [Frankiaceae bacterium]
MTDHPNERGNDRLTAVAVEIEQHAAASGWDQPPRLFALVPTAELVQKEPDIAAQLGIAVDADRPDALTPVEQDDLPEGPLDEVLAGITWPPEVAGCALASEAVVLPPGAEDDAPAGDDDELAAWAAGHPDRRDVRIAVAVLRDGSTGAALRIRAAGGDAGAAGDIGDEVDGADGTGDELVTGDDLAPNLAEALRATLG